MVDTKEEESIIKKKILVMQHAANNIGIVLFPAVQTEWPPLTVIEYFKSTLSLGVAVR